MSPRQIESLFPSRPTLCEMCNIKIFYKRKLRLLLTLVKHGKRTPLIKDRSGSFGEKRVQKTTDCHSR